MQIEKMSDEMLDDVLDKDSNDGGENQTEVANAEVEESMQQ